MGHIALHPGWARNPQAGRFLGQVWFLQPGLTGGGKPC